MEQLPTISKKIKRVCNNEKTKYSDSMSRDLLLHLPFQQIVLLLNMQNLCCRNGLHEKSLDV